MAKECSQFFDEEYNPYSELMRIIQTNSTIVFFIGLHIPLCRLHSAFCFLTSIFPMMLSLKTKYWFYERANDIVCIFYKNDKEAKNYVKKQKDMQT